MTAIMETTTATGFGPMVTVPASVLRELATVTVAAGKDDSLPTLTGVRIEWESGLIRMVTTDRYRLAVCEWADESLADAVPGSALVPAGELASYVKGLPKPKRGQLDFPVTLTLDEVVNGRDKDHAVTFTCTTFDGQQVRRVVGLRGDFPKWAPLIPSEAERAESGGVLEVAYNPGYLADVAKMPLKRNQPVRMLFSRASRPVLCEGEGQHVAWMYLLMPIRKAR